MFLLKLISECLVSLHLLILFLYFDNNGNKLENSSDLVQNNKDAIVIPNSNYNMFKSNMLIFLISLFSPILIFMVYFYNYCIAQNLAITFEDYKNNYYKRIHYYKFTSYICAICLLIVALLFNKGEINVSNQFTINLFSFFYIGIFYIVLIIIILYIIKELIFVFRMKRRFSSSFNNNVTETHTINVFIIQQIAYILTFLICYTPNNLIQLFQIFMKNKIVNENLLERSSLSAMFPYLLSSLGIFSFCIKMTDPYIHRYLANHFKIIFKPKISNINNTYSDIELNTLNENKNFEDILFKEAINQERNESNINLNNTENNNNLNKEKLIDDNNKADNNYNNKTNTENNTNIPRESVSSDIMADTFNNLNKNLNVSDHLIRLIAISSIIEDERINESKLKTNKQYNSNLGLCFLDNFPMLTNQELPWDEKYYQHKTEFIRYESSNIPESLNISKEDRESNKFKSIRFRIRSYASLVFKHIRSIDTISTKNFLESLDLQNNSISLENAFVSGGRSANPILNTFDKKYLIKTISKEEKNLLVKLLNQFHVKMSYYSLLCRIYGLYRIKISGKNDTHIIVMKNMQELPDNVSLNKFINLK